MKRFLSAAIVLVILLGFALPSSAATVAKVERVYGTETRAFDCKGFTDFYAGNMFVWFQVDFDISSTLSTALLNQQVLGESTIKNAVTNYIKLGGVTVKQLLQSGGNMYAAMIAFETQNQKLRMSVWMSWAATSVQSLFEKEVKSNFTLEILDGLVVPASGYVKGNGKVVAVKPVKYQVPISDLEFKTDPSNANYTADKESWVKPMFEDLKAEWKLVSGNTSTTSSKTSTTSSKPSTVSSKSSQTSSAANETSSQAVTSGESQVDESTASTITGDESEVVSADSSGESSSSASSAKETSGGERGGFSALPLILGILGVLVIGGGAAFFVISGKKNKSE